MSGTGRNGRCTTELDEELGVHKAELNWIIKTRRTTLQDFPMGRVLRSDPFFDPAFPEVTGVVELVPGGTAKSMPGHFDARVVVQGVDGDLRCTRVKLSIGSKEKRSTQKVASRGDSKDRDLTNRTFEFRDFGHWKHVFGIGDKDLLITASFVFRKRFEEETFLRLREDKDSKDKVKNTKDKDKNTKHKDKNTNDKDTDKDAKDKDKEAKEKDKVTVRKGSKTRHHSKWGVEEKTATRHRHDSENRKSFSRDRKGSRDKSRRASVRKPSERREDKGESRRGSSRDKSMGRWDKSVDRRNKSSAKSSAGREEKTKVSPRRRWDSEESDEGWDAVKASLDRLVHDFDHSDDDSDFGHQRAKGHRKHK